LVATILLGILPRPIAAQWIDPDACWTCPDTRMHAAAGALIDAGLHLPIAPKGFRDTVAKRVLVVGVIGLVYEVGQLSVAQSTGVAGTPGFGIGWKDLVADLAGALAVEVVVALGKVVIR
jgi:hypothetical protein